MYCAANGLRPHYDSSNDSLNFQRNRIRHLLIPSLESYNPRFREAVLRTSQSLKSDYSLLMETLEEAWGLVVISVEEDVVTFDAGLLAGTSIGLQRNLLKHAIQILRPKLDVNFSTLERATDLVRDAAHSSAVDLKGGLRMIREAGNVYVCTADSSLSFNLWPQLPSTTAVPVSIPGQIGLAGGWRLTSERWHIPALVREQAERNEDPFQVWLDADRVPESLELRVRRQGDCFEPLGLGGHSQKLSDFFVNEKLPQRARDYWPLLCAGDKIFWVPGYRPAHSCRLTERTKSALYFSVSPPPEKTAE
jgi:tRNA(Ile)-lysidine synthase